MYSFPSTSQIRAPSPRATKNGALSTLRNARTGEFTPPGIRFCARAKNSEEREIIQESIEYWSAVTMIQFDYSTTTSLHKHRPHIDTASLNRDSLRPVLPAGETSGK